MKSFRAYLKQTKIFFIACVFMAAVSTAVICLYQLPLEAAVYLAVLWLGAGAADFFIRLCLLQTEGAELNPGGKSSGD